MGRIREKIDQELAGMTFSDSMMERVLEQTSQSAEETKERKNGYFVFLTWFRKSRCRDLKF